MTDLATLNKLTDALFKESELSSILVPEPNLDWKRRMDVLEDSGLTKHGAMCLHDMRCSQAEEMGFQSVEIEDAVEMLMGEPYTSTEEKSDRQTLEWVYNHHTNEIVKGAKCTWGCVPTDYILTIKIGQWYMPPFRKEELWRVRQGKLDYLNREIPYRVLLRIQEIKKLNLFNGFSVVGPLDAWDDKTDIDPIVFAEIWELGKNDKGADTSGKTTRYFLAQL